MKQAEILQRGFLRVHFDPSRHKISAAHFGDGGAVEEPRFFLYNFAAQQRIAFLDSQLLETSGTLEHRHLALGIENHAGAVSFFVNRLAALDGLLFAFGKPIGMRAGIRDKKPNAQSAQK